jgi:Cys-tRNA(Pro)/Cys-tRNA(Cys) deacylase
MGVSEDRVFKTLVVRADDRYAVALLPASQTLSMRKVARALDARSADMAGAGDAQRMTGYVVGGISPFGQKRRLVTIAHETIDEFPTVFVSAGRRGWDVEIAPAHLVAALAAVGADIVIP